MTKKEIIARSYRGLLIILATTVVEHWYIHVICPGLFFHYFMHATTAMSKTFTIVYIALILPCLLIVLFFVLMMGSFKLIDKYEEMLPYIKK